MDPKEWDSQAGHPMQSWGWGEFRQRMGNRVSRVVGDKQYQIIWSKLYFLPVWFGYIPMGPMPTRKDIKLLTEEGLKNNAVGIRMEPNVEISKLDELPREKLVSGRHLFKPKTYWIDLDLDEDQLLNNMHQKARYNIRLAQKHGVAIAEDPEAVDAYVELMFGNTTKRQKIYSHSEKYHRELAKLNFVHLFKALFQSKTIAVWMIFILKDRAYYAYGAFDEEYRQVMAPALGLWEIMKWAKARGVKALDLWGAEEGKGFSKFKEQFGPRLVETIGTWDLPVATIGYKLFRLGEEARWKILRTLK